MPRGNPKPLSIETYAYGGRCDTKGHRYGPVYTAFCLRDPSSGVDKHFDYLETLRDFVRKSHLDARVDNWQAWQGSQESYLIPGTIARPGKRSSVGATVDGKPKGAPMLDPHTKLQDCPPSCDPASMNRRSSAQP